MPGLSDHNMPRSDTAGAIGKMIARRITRTSHVHSSQATDAGWSGCRDPDPLGEYRIDYP